MTMTRGNVIQAHLRRDPSRYTNHDQSFSVHIEHLENNIYLLTKQGYQTLDDVDAEAELIMGYLEKTNIGTTPYLCVDVSNFKGLSRKTRAKQATMVEDMPFGGVAAYGLSLPLRVLAMVFVRRSNKKPIRIFGNQSDALDYLRGLRTSEGPNSIEEAKAHTSSRSSSGPLPKHLVTRFSAIREVRRFGDQEYPSITPSDWRYRNEEAPFEVTNSLLGPDIILSESSGCGPIKWSTKLKYIWEDH